MWKTMFVLNWRNVRAAVSGMALATCVCWAVAHAASVAQEVAFSGPGGFVNLSGFDSEAPLTSMDVERYGRLLGFDEAQLEAARTLADGAKAEWRAAMDKQREESEAVRAEFEKNRDPSVFTSRMPNIARETAQLRVRLEESLAADFKTLATDEQLARWDAVARTMRRDRTMSRGRLGGESVDLVRLSEELNLAAHGGAELVETLGRYEVALDRELVERNELMDKARGLMGGPDAMNNPEFLQVREKARQARLAVKSINESYARQIAALLPEAEATRWNSAFRSRAFPQIFGESFASETLKAVGGYEDLTPEQKAAIDDIKQSYASVSERLNREWAEAQAAYEQTEEGYLASLMGGMRVFIPGAEGDANDPTAEARAARMKSDETTLEKIRGVLSDAQRERLPQRRERGPRLPGMEGMRMAGGGGGDGGPAVFVVQGDPSMIPPGAAGQQVNVVRTVRIGPDGKPQETIETSVHPLGHGETPADGAEDVDVDIITTPPPAEAPKPE